MSDAKWSRPTFMEKRRVPVGAYTVIEELNGAGTVFHDDDEHHVFHAETFDEALAWAKAQ